MYKLSRQIGKSSLLTACLMALFVAPLPSAGQPPSEIRYCVDPNWMPYEAIRNGIHVGIGADYLHLIAQLAGLKITLVPTRDWQQTLAYLRQGHCELASMLNRTPARQAYLSFSHAFFDSANVFVTKSHIPYVTGYDSIEGYKIGLVEHYRQAEFVAQHYPDVAVKLYGSESEGLIALSGDDVDIFVGSQLSVTSYLQKYGLQELQVVGLAKPYDKLRVGVIKSHEHLLPAINRAIETLTETQHVEIFRRWNNVKVIDQINYHTIGALAAIISLVFILIFWRNHYIEKFNRTLLEKNAMLESLQQSLLDKNKQLEFLSNHDALTGLYNRHFMVKRCEDEIARMGRYGQPACLILFDIDHFKQINDCHGHSCGDMVLEKLAKSVSESIRDIDVLCRWGGEEFVILCPQTPLTDSLNLAKRISQAIYAIDVHELQKVTCSFGVAQYQVGENFFDWFERADVSLYKAKDQGRDTIIGVA